MAFLPLFAHTESSVGRLNFWRGKWQSNLEIRLGLEIIQVGLSNELFDAQFGLREGPQNQLQTCATHRGIWPIFHSAAQNFA